MRDVSKAFGRVPALSHLTILAPKGRITVLLGPNGAGKTTAIRVITGALTPDRGYVRTFGYDPDRFGEDVRRRCGVVSAKPALYDRLSGWDNLQYSAELYGLGRNAIKPIREAAARFGILDALDQRVGGYSTGMKTRLALARSVLHDPELLLFDEPTSGLDPESSHAVLELIREMTADGHTVVMCTHLLIEAEGLADQIVVLENGTDLIHGTQDTLTRQYWPDNLVRFDAEEPTQLDMLVGMEGVVAVERVDGVSQVQLDDLARVPDIVARARRRRRAADPGRSAQPLTRGSLLRHPARTTRRCRAHRRRLLPRGPPPDRSESRSVVNTQRMGTVMRTDLRQLWQSKDFWIPMGALGLVFFVVVPAVLLSIINNIGNVGAVRQVSQALQLLPAGRPEGGAPARQRRNQGVVRAGGVPAGADRRHRPADHLHRGRLELDRGRARAGHRRVPRPLPRRRARDLPGQAHRQPDPRLPDHGHRLRPLLADGQPDRRSRRRRVVLPDGVVVAADPVGAAAVPARSRCRSCCGCRPGSRAPRRPSRRPGS